MSIDNFLKNKSAFTYIELLIVVTVILVMSGVGMVSFSSFSQKSRDNRRRTDIEMIRNALNLYYSNIFQEINMELYHKQSPSS